MTINGKEFEIQKIAGYSKEVKKLTGNLKGLKDTSEEIKKPEIKQPKFKITGYTGNVKEFENIKPDVSSFNLWEKLKTKIEQIKPAMQQFKQSLSGAGPNSKELELVKYKISEIEEKLENAKNGKIHLNTKEIIEAEAQLERLNNKKETLEKGNSGKGFSTIFSSIGKILPKMNEMSGITVRIKNQIQQWSGGIKSGLSHVLKYAMALFSLRGIYSVLSNCANSWLSSQNAGAKQLSANIEYMKYAMGSALAPVIQFVTNCVYQLLKAIQSVVYALFRINIFANASASAFKNAQKQAKNTSKQLSNIHSEINNVEDHNSNTSPNVGDMSKLDPTNSLLDAISNGNWYEVGSIIGQKLNEAMQKIPWDKIQNAAKNIANNIGNFINGFTDRFDWTLLGTTIGNGINTAFLFSNTLLKTINWGNIGTSIANFLNSSISTIDWNQIGQTFTNVLNAIIHLGFNFVTTFDWRQFGISIAQSITSFITNIDWATAGQTLGEGVKGIFNSISAFLGEFDWTAIGESVKTFVQNIDWVGIWNAIKETIKNAIGSVDGILSGLFGENTATIIEAIAIAIGLVTTATKIYSVVKSKETGILIANAAAWIAANAPIILITAAIAAIIAIIILCIKHWDEIKETVINVCNKIKETVSNWCKNIGDFFSDLWKNICNIFGNIGNWFSDKFKNAKDGIVNTFQNIGNWFQDRRNDITNAFSNVGQWFSEKFQDVYNSIRNIFSNIGNFFGGIWEGIKNTFSALGTKIGDAISGAVKNGINGVITLIENTINSAIGLINGGIKLINLIPGVTVGTINKLTLPRLAKGNVAYDETLAIFGEYSGASNNPEITTPQNIMRDTFEDVLSNYSGNNNDRPIYLTVYVGNQKLGQILLEDLRDRTRRTGKDIEALVGG